VLDDIIGIVILAVVVAIVGGGAFSLGPVLKLCLAAVAFVAVASFLVLTVCCFAAQAIGLEAALGAFAAGLILSASKHTHDIDAAVKPLVALFATVFFVLIGTGLDLSVLNPLDPANREGLVVAAFLLAVSIAGKVGLIFLGLGQPGRHPHARPGGRHPADGDWHHLPGPDPAAACDSSRTR
jgi:Kef-type K+ transport system membrane component KefB